MDEAARWAAGAEGERRVAAALASLPVGWTVVHDRLLRPGRSGANLDHIAVGPTGVYLIDAKNRAGRVAEHDGGLFQHRWRDGRTETVSLASELTKVHGMAAYMAAETDRPVTPVLCLAGDRAQDFGAPRMVRGVWVVPVAALPGWIRARPVVFPPEVVPSVATRVITDFPSTTTDAALLEAMAGAALARSRPGRKSARALRSSAAPARSPRAARPRRASRFLRGAGRVLMAGVMFALFVSLLGKLPDLFTAGVEHLAASGASPAVATTGSSPSPTSGPATRKTATRASAGKAAAPKAEATKVKPSPPKPLGPPDCANASAAEIQAVIHRTVKPVYTSRGCLWGTRLDDGSTALVSIGLQAGHDSWDSVMEASVKQKRAIFGADYSSVRGIGTRVSIATGQPINGRVRARADTVVVVAGTSLGVSDDRARAMAVAIAAAANG